jgi:hypothetical protein
MSEEEKKSSWQWRNAAIFGAVIPHPALLLIVVLYSCVCGAKEGMADGARVVTGWEGIKSGVISLFAAYLLSLGIFPLVLSVIGAIVGVAVSWVKHALRNK